MRKCKKSALVLISFTLFMNLSCTSLPEENSDLTYDENFDESTLDVPSSEQNLAGSEDASGFGDDFDIDNEASIAVIDENMSANNSDAPFPQEESAEPFALDSSEDAGELDEFADFDAEDSSDLPLPEIAFDEAPESDSTLETFSDADQISQAPMAPATTLSITNLQFKANDTGGTVVIDGDGPLQYSIRRNDRLKQFIVDIPYARLPARLQRTLNTRDLQGAVGSIDAYQSNENSARIVVQLREGSPEPTVATEGNSLLVIASNIGGAPQENFSSNEAAMTSQPTSQSSAAKTSEIPQVLTSASLSDFMTGNTDFYGKKISIETTEEMEVRDALRFIMDESGINMIISDSVKGKMSLKLRQVPWDQALILIMKSKNLGYIRQGNVIRITTLEELRTEETEATALAARQLEREPLKVRMYPVNYAKSTELLPQIEKFLTDKRGKASADIRTNTLIVTDVDDNLGRIQRLIESLDHEPPQVLIEGKIVEATESFSRDIGINWGLSGAPKIVGQSGSNNVSLRPQFSSNPSSGGKTGLLSLNMGTFDLFGNLNMALQLQEQDDKVKILSSPRVVTMSNLEAKISQETQITVGNKVTQVVAGGDPTIEPIRVNIPLTLTVTPQITNDNAVMMKVDIERSFAQAVADSEPNINKRSASTNILVRNGETAVIGGIYQNDDSVGERKIPFLGNLPVVGWLFKSQTKINSKNELMIFLTPRILTKSGISQATTISEGIPSGSELESAGSFE